MNEKQQIIAFAKDLDTLVYRYEREFQLSYASAIGVIQMKVHSMCFAGMQDDEEIPPDHENTRIQCDDPD